VKLALEEEIRDAGRFVSLRLAEPQTNAIMFEVASEGTDARAKEAMAQAEAGSIDLASDVEIMRRHISAYDPIYFAIGWRDRFNARFQFSFKYRLFERGPPEEAWWKQVARDVYVAYTQTSLWDLETFSRPFYDSSYKPTVFLLHEDKVDVEGAWRVAWQAGFQHESNGKGGGPAPSVPLSAAGSARHLSESRSLNSLYVAPRVRWTRDDGSFIEAALRASAYSQTDDNEDIARFRGYVEANFRAGSDRGLQLGLNVRGHPGGHGSVECNATWPAIRTPLLRSVLPETLGGYAQLQYFNGYGESLLDYDVRRKDQLRFGLMLVR
jgi:outer membrane phospholipase A